MAFRTKRIHEDATPDDGQRVLVDRLWPRGVSKERAALDTWPQEVTPSNGLRKAVHAGEITWEQFHVSYRAELADSPEAQETLDTLRQQATEGNITLLTAVKDPSGAHVGVLLDILQQG